MAQNLGSLGSMFLDFGVNVARFESDFDRAQKVARREADKMKRTMAGVAGALGVGLGVGAFAGWIKGAISAQDKADELGQKLGITTEAASRLTIASKFSATELGGVSSSMVRLIRNAADAAAGLKAPKAAFDAIGVSVTDSNGKMKSADVILDEIGRKWTGFQDGVNKSRVAVELFGKSGTDMVPMLNDWNTNVADAIKLADELGVTVTSKTGAAAAQFADNLEKIGLVSQGVGNQIASALVPALNELTVKALTFFRSDQWKKALDVMGRGATWVVDNLGRIMSAVKLIGELAVINIAGKMANALLLATGRAIAFSKQLIISAALSRELGIAADQGIGASLKKIGYMPAAIGAVTAAFAGWRIGTWLREEFQIVADAGDYMVYGIAQGWEEIKRGAAIAWETVKLIAVGSIDAIIEAFASMIRGLSSATDIQVMGRSLFGNTSAELDAVATKLSNVLTPVDNYKAALAGIGAEYAKNSAANDAMLADMQAATAATFAAKDGATGAADALGLLAGAGEDVVPSLGGASDAAQKLAEAQEKFRADTLRMAASLRGPIAKAQDEYRDGILEAWKAHLKGEATIDDFVERQKVLAVQLAKTTVELIKQSDVVGNYLASVEKEKALIGLTDRQREIARAIEEQTEAWKNLDPEVRKYLVAMGKVDPTTTKGKAAIAGATASLYDMEKAFERTKKEAEAWNSMWEGVGSSAADAFGQFAVDALRDIDSVGDAFDALGDSLVDTAARAVQQMIAEFVKLQVINPMLNNIFGTSLQTGTGGSMFGGGGGGNWMQTIMGLFGAGSGAYVNTLAMGASGATGMMGAGVGANWAYGAGTAVVGSQLMGGATAGANTMGTIVGAGSTTAATGGAMASTMSWLAAAAPYIALIAFAVSMGDKWFKQGWDPNDEINADIYDKGFMEAGMSGDIKGIGGNTLVDWTVLQTDKWLQDWFGMSENSAAMWSGSSGIMRAWGYKKPEIDWSELFWNFGPEGVTGENVAHIRAKGGWFRSDKRWDETADLSEDTRKQLELFWARLSEDTEAFAKQYSLDTTKAIEAAYTASFNGDGSSIASTGTINGRTYEGDTPEQFFSRVQSEAFIALLGQKDAGLDAAVEKYRATAEQLADATRVVLAVNENLVNGLHFLGTESDATITDVLTFVEGMMKAGETVADAFARLQQANQAYFDFVGQFKEPAVYVNDFEAALSGIHAQLVANIDQANALARAAGAEGAATEDLVRIHAFAAQQFAAALQQLEDSAQDLAFNLGLTNIGSYDAISAEIARLQGRASSASQPIRDFGAAMGEAANRANEAINLLLGNLSPLNDREKLEVARSGLMRGSVTQEQFLQIARRLFGSSRQYETEFAFAQQYPGGNGAMPRLGGSGVSDRVAGGGLTEAERKRLEELLEQQAGMDAARQLEQYQRLAEQLAEISMAREEDWHAIADRMGIDLGAFAEGLGLQSEEELAALIEREQAQLDSAGQNTRSIVDALHEIRDEIRRGNGEEVVTDTRSGRYATDVGSRQREAEVFGEHAARRFERTLVPGLIHGRTRNVRPQVRA